MYESLLLPDTFLSECSILLLQSGLLSAALASAVQMSSWVRVMPTVFLNLLFLGAKVFCFLYLLLYFASAHLKITC